MVFGTRGRYAGSRRRSDGGEPLILYTLNLSLNTHMVVGTRGRYAGSRRRRDGGELLISYSLYII